MVDDIRFTPGSPDCICKGSGKVYARPQGAVSTLSWMVEDWSKDVERPCVLCSYPAGRPTRTAGHCRYCLSTGDIYYQVAYTDPVKKTVSEKRFMQMCPVCRWHPFTVSYYMAWLVRPWDSGLIKPQPRGMLTEAFQWR